MLKLNSSSIKQIIDSLEKDQEKINFDNLDKKAMLEGIRVSRQALTQPEDIALTPYTANMLKQLDKIDDLTVRSSETKMEKHIETETKKLLLKYCGPQTVNYDFNKDPWDYDNYIVDCWRNFKEGKNIRHATPEMNKEREKNFAKFYKPFTKDWSFSRSYSKSPLIWDNLIKLLDKMIPNVYSASHWMEVNLPFMNKHTNVGYPFYKNDKRIDKSTGKTYAQLTSDIAKKLSPREVTNYPYVAFGRNLRNKARPILGGSRIQALVFNQLEAKEIETYKQHSPLFIGYNDDEVVKNKMIQLGEWLMKNRDFTCFNRDYASFDTTVKPGLRRFVDSISVIKALDKKAKDIAYWRGVSHFKSLLSNGLIGRVIPIYDRILSGEIDTNRGGGIANAIACIYAMNSLDKNWNQTALHVLSYGTSPLWVMGDDNLSIQKKNLSNDKFAKLVELEFGLNVSTEKGEYGLFFLQRRLFFKDNKWTFITPFTRIIRSLASKETRKGLGPAGWTIASYMLLHQLIEWPELMIDVAKIFSAYDKFKMGTVWTVKQMTRLVSEEDRMAKAKDKSAISTFDRLYDGDPLKKGFFNADGSIQESFLSKIHSILLQGLKSTHPV